MSLFSRPGGGGIDPAQLAALVDDNEAGALLASALASLQDARLEVVGKVGFEGQSTRNVDLATRLQVLDAITERGEALSSQLGSVRFELLTEILGLVTSRTQEVMNLGNSNRSLLEARIDAAALPVGFVAEFPAGQVPGGWEAVQGQPETLPTSIGTASSSRTTGSNPRGFAYAATGNRLWSLNGSTLASLDLTLNRWDAQTYALPQTPVSGASTAVLHDLADNRVLATIGRTSASLLGNTAAYTFDTTGRTYTQVVNFQLSIGADNYAGLGGTSCRLADGRLFWLPNELFHLTDTAKWFSNMGTNGGYYFLYTPSTNTLTTHRFSNWASVGSVAIGGTNINSSLPVCQLPNGELLLQETGGSLRYFRVSLMGNTLTAGSGFWAANAGYQFCAHPQGAVVFSPGSTVRRYYNATTDALDATTASLFSNLTVTVGSPGSSGKAYKMQGNNYAIPASNGTTSDAAALAYDTFERLGTVKARKTNP